MFSAMAAMRAPLRNIAVEREPRLRFASTGATLPSAKMRPSPNAIPPINSKTPISKHSRSPSFRRFEKTVIAQTTVASESLNAKTLAQAVGSCSAWLAVTPKNTAPRTTTATEIVPAPNQPFLVFAISCSLLSGWVATLHVVRIGVCYVPTFLSLFGSSRPSSVQNGREDGPDDAYRFQLCGSAGSAAAKPAGSGESHLPSVDEYCRYQK